MQWIEKACGSYKNGSIHLDEHTIMCEYVGGREKDVEVSGVNEEA